MVKYKELAGKAPIEAAKIVGNVEKSNYLAHAIRKIEQAISSLGKHYRVVTITSMTSKKSRIHFYDQCCEIWLPAECEDMDDKRIRLTLAHELGHLIFNIGSLKNPEILKNIEASNDEELFAWEFAFYLIRKKSDEHKNNLRHSKFIYDDEDLKGMLSGLVRNKKPEIYDEIAQSLRLS
jgi:hypothetical protein